MGSKVASPWIRPHKVWECPPGVQAEGVARLRNEALSLDQTRACFKTHVGKTPEYRLPVAFKRRPASESFREHDLEQQSCSGKGRVKILSRTASRFLPQGSPRGGSQSPSLSPESIKNRFPTPVPLADTWGNGGSRVMSGPRSHEGPQPAFPSGHEAATRPGASGLCRWSLRH